MSFESITRAGKFVLEMLFKMFLQNKPYLVIYHDTDTMLVTKGEV